MWQWKVLPPVFPSSGDTDSTWDPASAAGCGCVCCPWLGDRGTLIGTVTVSICCPPQAPWSAAEESGEAVVDAAGVKATDAVGVTATPAALGVTLTVATAAVGAGDGAVVGTVAEPCEVDELVVVTVLAAWLLLLSLAGRKIRLFATGCCTSSSSTSLNVYVYTNYDKPTKVKMNSHLILRS